VTTANVRAVTSFITGVKGQTRLVALGDVLAGADPVVKAHPELFEPDEHKPTA
jgi:hypothetical protein